jgi:hypothetical protein
VVQTYFRQRRKEITVHEVSDKASLKSTSRNRKHRSDCLGTQRVLSGLTDDQFQAVDKVGHQMINGVQSGQNLDNISVGVGVLLVENSAQEGGEVLDLSGMIGQKRSRRTAYFQSVLVAGGDS